MKDYSLTITIRDDKPDFEGRNISMKELAQMAGFLQVFVGIEGLRWGLDMDDVKDNMLDIHLAAMEIVEAQMKEGLPEGDWTDKRKGGMLVGREKEAYPEREKDQRQDKKGISGERNPAAGQAKTGPEEVHSRGGEGME